jgi:hypothetical protein
MKNKKRLFKKIKNKINVVNLIITSLSFFVVFSLFVFFNREDSYVYVDLTFSRSDWSTDADPPEFWIVENIEVGDVAYDSLGKVIAEVVEVEKLPHIGKTREWVTLVLKLSTVYDERTKTHILNGQKIAISNDLELTFGQTFFQGEISNVYESLERRFSKYEVKQARLSVWCKNYEFFHAEDLKTLKAFDSKGEQNIGIENFSLKPAFKTTTTINGVLVKSIDPMKTDINLEIIISKVKCLKNACFLYNERSPLMVGSKIWLDTGEKWLGSYHNDESDPSYCLITKVETTDSGKDR